LVILNDQLCFNLDVTVFKFREILENVLLEQLSDNMVFRKRLQEMDILVLTLPLSDSIVWRFWFSVGRRYDVRMRGIL
jgi:hypothetical protein